jgi:lysozyme family protein
LIGRFISEDPAADPASPNLYTYCGNNPLNRIDPTGQFWWAVLIAAVLGGVQSADAGGSFLDGFVRAGVMAAVTAGFGEVIQGLSICANFGQVASIAVSGCIMSAFQTALNGDDLLQILRSGFFGGIRAAIFSYVTGPIDKYFAKTIPTKWINDAIMDGINGGLNSIVYGGNFVAGFVGGVKGYVESGRWVGKGSSRGSGFTGADDPEAAGDDPMASCGMYYFDEMLPGMAYYGPPTSLVLVSQSDYFDELIGSVLNFEGGFSDNPNDHGGITNRGITFATFKLGAEKYLGMEPTLENLKNLTVEQAKTLYRKMYWEPMGGPKIMNKQVAHIMFDMAVDSGVGTAVRYMQKTLNNMGNSLAVDGVAGPLTLNAINTANSNELFNNFKTARINFYKAIIANDPTQKVFEQGWMNRVNSFVWQN